jgi:hypothetical protein
MYFLYLGTILEDMRIKYHTEAHNYFDSISKIDEVKFGVYVTFLLLLFLFYLRIIISKLNKHLLKIRKLLAMLPTSIMMKNITQMKQIIHKIS